MTEKTLSIPVTIEDLDSFEASITRELNTKTNWGKNQVLEIISRNKMSIMMNVIKRNL